MKSEIPSSKKVMVFGTFDIFHPGHAHFLKQARKLGRHLTVIIARDRNVKTIKGKLPRNKENVRLKRVRMSGLAQEVILGNLSDKYAVIRKFKPDVIALGYDQLNYTEGLAKKFKNIKIIRLKAFKPHIYKSSLIN
ncbi:MAG: adenylyltransferase/cytidyltransferase family protein [Patescibacteria group bacterium]|jgi:FAD synthetase